MQCIKCKKEIPEESAFCPHCGLELTIPRSFHLLGSQQLKDVYTEASSLAVQIARLQKRFDQLELLISASNTGEVKPVAGAEEIEPPTLTPTTPTETAHSIQQPIKSAPSREEIKAGSTSPFAPVRSTDKKPAAGSTEFEIRLGQKWLLIAGIIFSVLAVGWFLKFSFEQNWVSPTGRVLSAGLIGAAFLGAGEFFRRKNFHLFGLYLIGGGIATLYFTAFAAFQIYSLISQLPAFSIMISVTILAGTLALVYDTRWLAVLGLTGGFLTPMILGTGQDNQIALMTYLVILNLAILTIAFFKQWRLLNYLGFIFTWLIFSGWYFSHYDALKFWRTITFLNIFFLTYAFVPFVYYIVKEHQNRLTGIAFTMPNSFVAVGFSIAMIKEAFQLEAVSIITITYAVIFLWMAWFIYRRHQKPIDASIMLLAKAIFFLILTVPIFFSEHWITFFWAIQAAVIFWVAVKTQNKWLYISAFLFMILTLIKYFIYDYSLIYHFQFGEHFFQKGFAYLLVERILAEVTILLALLQISRIVKKAQSSLWMSDKGDSIYFLSAFTGILFLILNAEAAGFFYDYLTSARFAAISILWTLFSIMLIIFGFIKNQANWRKIAIGLFFVTMIKVFLYDMSNVSTPYRIISFLVLGLMLISASYLYHRFKDLILSSNSAKNV